MMAKFQNVMIPIHRTCFNWYQLGLFSYVVISAHSKIFRNQMCDVRWHYLSNVHAFRYGYLWYSAISGHQYNTRYQRPHLIPYEGYSKYHHAINGYWVVDDLRDAWSTSRIIWLDLNNKITHAWYPVESMCT